MAIRIQRLSTTGGFLEKAPIEFAKELTCIIGARGTCKSTVLETIRFAFDCDQSKIREMLDANIDSSVDSPSHKGLLATTLKGATTRCEIWEDTGDTQTLTLERDIESGTRVYKEGVKQLTNSDILRCIEIYSQGELQAIAEDGFRRLELIDRPNHKRIVTLQGERLRDAGKLKEIGNAIRARRAGIESRRAELRSLEQYQKELDDLRSARPELSPELDAERTKYNERHETVGVSIALAEEWIGLAEGLSAFDAIEAEFRSNAARLKALDVPEALALAKRFEMMADFGAKVLRESKGCSAELPELVKKLGEQIEKLNERYFSLRKDQQALNEVLRKEDQLKQQIVQLERIKDEVSKLSAELTNLKGGRTVLRQNIARINDEIFELRIQEVEKINRSYHDRVLLTLTQASHARGYKSTLLRLLERSRLRSQEDIAGEIAKKVLPNELVDIVESGDSQRLSSVLDRDLGQMARLVGYLVDNDSLYDVETEVFEDELEITLYDEGVAKRVDQLSKGQKATAMLPLILREADYPLIFDQPEDDLDNRFIFETLVERIRELKKSRQLIFVTHNANIPVLGDAESVVVMSMDDPNRAAKPVIGKVEDVKDRILSLLEGGAAAFRMRQEKYGSLLR